MVLDEPTSSLTRKDVEGLFDLIDRLKNQGHAIVYISHFIEEVQRVADRVTVLRDGKSVDSKPTEEFTADGIITMMVGRDVKDLYPRSKRKRGEKILQVNCLAGVKKPQSVSLTLHRGEVLGIAGLIGAGRTEFVRALFGLETVRAGEIKIGLFAGPASPLRRWAQGMGLVSENRKEEGLAQSLSIADNMTLSRLKGFGPLNLVLPRKQHKAAARWIDLLDLRCREPSQPVSDLSGGNQQKVAIARLLQHDVDVLLLDEPTRGIDVGAKAIIYRIIDELATGADWTGNRPRAILMISSYIPELLGVCDRIGVMCRGRLGAVRPVEEIDEHQIMIEATGQETI